MQETEKWIQCALCEKWRVVEDSLNIDETQAWYCKYNIFSATHNTCEAPQEQMPESDEDTDAEEDSLPLDGEDEEEEEEEEEEDECFCPSSCACEICTEVNYAVKNWTCTPEEHTQPLLRLILKSITNTEHIAIAAEDDKCFKRGTSVNTALIKNPPIHHVPKSVSGNNNIKK
jgi:TATA-binding protein-associated factor Taf7